jgi:hypothetical protein
LYEDNPIGTLKNLMVCLCGADTPGRGFNAAVALYLLSRKVLEPDLMVVARGLIDIYGHKHRISSEAGRIKSKAFSEYTRAQSSKETELVINRNIGFQFTFGDIGEYRVEAFVGAILDPDLPIDFRAHLLSRSGIAQIDDIECYSPDASN